MEETTGVESDYELNNSDFRLDILSNKRGRKQLK